MSDEAGPIAPHRSPFGDALVDPRAVADFHARRYGTRAPGSDGPVPVELVPYAVSYAAALRSHGQAPAALDVAADILAALSPADGGEPWLTATYLHASLCRQLGRLDAALAGFDQIIALADPRTDATHHAGALFHSAMVFKARGDWREAAHRLRACLVGEPAHGAARREYAALAAADRAPVTPAALNLDIGGQNNRDDQGGKWTVVDLHAGADIRLDLERDPLPLGAGSVANIYSSHCLEHLEPNRLRAVFTELSRVLAPHGRIRVVVPSFRKGVVYYFFCPWLLRRPLMPRLNSNTPVTRMSRLSSWFYTETSVPDGTPGHKSTWDFALMRTYLQEAGFVRIRRTGLHGCSPVFRGKDHPGYRAFSLYVEAEKGSGERRRETGPA
jgi:SAM-dependent methyltransferase